MSKTRQICLINPLLFTKKIALVVGSVDTALGTRKFQPITYLHSVDPLSQLFVFYHLRNCLSRFYIFHSLPFMQYSLEQCCHIKLNSEHRVLENDGIDAGGPIFAEFEVNVPPPSCKFSGGLSPKQIGGREDSRRVTSLQKVVWTWECYAFN